MSAAPARKREQIFDSTIPVIGKFGLKKTSTFNRKQSRGLSSSEITQPFSRSQIGLCDLV